MTHRTSTILSYWLVAFSLLMGGCSSAPRVSRFSFGSDLLTSRDGHLRFKMPDGWLNATNDSSAATSVVWLVRKDYAATLSVKEVGVDTETRREIDRSGLGRLADLTLALATSEQGATVTRQPEPISLQSKSICQYAYIAGHSNDRVQVIIFDTGERVYEVSMLVTAKMGEGSEETSVDFSRAFVQNLVW